MANSLSLRAWKYAALLAALILMAVVQPLAVHLSERVEIVGAAIALLVYLGVLLVIFERRRDRYWALFLLTCELLASAFHQINRWRNQAGAVAFHCLAAVFLAFAVVVILRHIFQRKTIRTDDVIGALCGYLLAAGVWGNLYALVYLTHPAAFQISQRITPQLGNWHMQRFFFDYFSVMALTTYGFSDIVPVGFPAYSLVWIESVFGQFYIAVVVAQLVGLRLAETINPKKE